jgi:cell division protein FtsZ
VVATGMDGVAMSALEPKSFRGTGSAPRRLGDAGVPRAAEVQPEPAPVMQESPSYEETIAAAAQAEPEWTLEAPPVEAQRPAAAVQPDLIAPDLYQAQSEPAIAQRRGYAAPEPVAAVEEPLFPELAYEERKPQKGGWLSLFGGRNRYDTAPPSPEPVREQRPTAPVPQARTVSSAQPAEEQHAEEGEDLEIPSFLRRLAN